ncbi:TonB-dependent receptor domain-containing protein [Novosphingobium sp. JCM 18896]|uniref:TonB-dependent receptor domain-containing protein n=1 Tax=Novosphingobium sp. JCM 18896 TaxID=2989731 RepID=UPI00222332A4|nr:TonB-dependent receptor [Novosphingobium sp. JCM 18896]MCW1432426.1 TonB-dependent receptor [Novosphingobium sp. JCM 18896]
MRHKNRLKLGAAVILAAAAISQNAIAQDAQPSETPAEEIVVTGTLIRGIAPGGSQAIVVGQGKIEAVGAVNTSDLIASIPQAGNFLDFVGVRGSSNFSLSVNRPSLRYLGSTSASTNSTLLLLDGHRLPGMGITQSSADLDAISPTAIERVDIVTDGGSATYGSDAVGGVMNFITRKSFDGLEVRGNYGFADDYQQYNAGLIVGKVWDDVSAYVAYDFAKHDAIYGADRDWSQSLDWVNGVPSSLDCNVGNLRVGTSVYALPGLTAGLGNRCDNTELTTIYPHETKHSVLGSLTVDTGGSVSFTLKGYYVNRENLSDGGPLSVAGGVTVRNTNPFAAPILAAIPGSPASASYQFNFSPVLGNFTRQRTDMESYGFTPSMKIDAGGGWQINALANYGVGKSEFIGQLLNASPINAAITAGTFNPFNLAAPSNATALNTAIDWFQYGRARHEMINARAVVDGALLSLPAGALRIAVGGEYLHEKYAGNNSRSLTATAVAALLDRKASRSVSSLFGELNIPVFGDGFGPFHSLSITGSGRYDKYSDFGGTFNPKVGVNFAPIEWINLRGNWGKAFQAPGISDIALGGAPTFTVLALAQRPYTNPAIPANGRTTLITLGGTITPLSPQKARTWSLGFDVNPPALAGLAAGLTYYSIDFKGVIGFPPIYDPSFYRDFADKNVTYDKGAAAMQAYFQALTAEGATNAAATIAQLPGGNFDSVYGVLDSRTQNLARAKTTGLDFYLRYNRETGFGGVFLDLSGSRILTFDRQSNPTAALVDVLENGMSKLRVSSSLGADVGNLRAQLTWNHLQGFKIIPSAATLNQERIGDYNVFNLFLQYKVPGESRIARDLVLSLNVDNLFDQDPPLYRGSSGSRFGVWDSFTLGRLVRLGISKKF